MNIKIQELSSQDIVIIGAGLSGMITALAFAKKNIKTVLIESQNFAIYDNQNHSVKSKAKNQKNFFITDPRTTAITAETANFFESIDIWDSLFEIAAPINDVYVVDNKDLRMLHFFKDLTDTKTLGFIIKNSQFKKILLDKVNQNPLINLIYAKCINIESYLNKTEVIISRLPDILEDDLIDNISANALNTNTAGINNTNKENAYEKISCDLLVMATAAKSFLHRKYFKPLILKTYLQQALVFDVICEKDHEGTAIEHFLPQGPFAILPLQDPKKTSIVWTVSDQYATDLMAISREELNLLVQDNFGEFLGDVKICDESSISKFALSAYVSAKYYHNRIALVADSAHIIHPLSGQGLNQGVKDILSLVSLIDKQSITQDMLLSYENSRKSDNLTMYFIIDKINSIFSNDIALLKYSRRLSLAFLDKCNFLKSKIAKYAMGYYR